MKRRYSLFYLVPYLARHRYHLAVGFLMVLLTVAAGMAAPWVLKYVVDSLRVSLAPERLPQYAGLILAIALVEGFFRFWMRKILIGASRDIEYDIRNDFFTHLQKMPLSFCQAHKTGDIMSRVTNDLNAVRSVLGPGIMYSMNTIVTVVVASAILIGINWKLTLVAYLPLALVSLTVKKLGQRIHDRFEEIQGQFSEINAKVQENLSGVRVVKAFAQEESELLQFERLNQEYIRRNVSLIRLWGIFYPLMAALIGLSSVGLLWMGGREVVAGRLTLGEFVAFMSYLSMLTWPTIAVGWVINIFQRDSASMKRILEIMEEPPGIRDSHGAAAPQRIEGAIEVRDLSFQYPNAPGYALRNISFKVAAGETLAIVGHTGSGKSTLINLLPRLFDPPPGTVFIDGKDVRQWPLSELRKSIGYVPQESFLFSESIRENIVFGREPEVPDREVEWAARVSQIEDDIQQFPQKLQTIVGERGITLSGGQKQRVAISRAVLVLPRILVLDDALSSVDTLTEEKILNQLSAVMRDRTTILVSHRISTVRGAHQIIVLQNGAIVEHGTHDSLMARQGIYADLYEKQLLEEELATA
jgi:ATP-binding cassette, subfamily B, multidrug efflux pump